MYTNKHIYTQTHTLTKRYTHTHTHTQTNTRSRTSVKKSVLGQSSTTSQPTRPNPTRNNTARHNNNNTTWPDQIISGRAEADPTQFHPNAIHRRRNSPDSTRPDPTRSDQSWPSSAQLTDNRVGQWTMLGRTVYHIPGYGQLVYRPSGYRLPGCGLSGYGLSEYGLPGYGLSGYGLTGKRPGTDGLIYDREWTMDGPETYQESYRLYLFPIIYIYIYITGKEN